jgi:hypothetical protein
VASLSKRAGGREMTDKDLLLTDEEMIKVVPFLNGRKNEVVFVWVRAIAKAQLAKCQKEIDTLKYTIKMCQMIIDNKDKELATLKQGKKP